VWLYGHSNWLGFGLIVALCAAVLLHGWTSLQADRELTRS
jgi:predicted exporter